MKSNQQRPKYVKKEKSNELEAIFKRVTEDFDADRYEDVYAFKRKELETKALEFLNKGNFSNEHIAKLFSQFLILYEKHMVNEAEIQLATYKAKEKFEEIIDIEDSTPSGGRPQNEFIFRIATEAFEEFEGANNGKQPSSIQLAELVSKKLKNKLADLRTKNLNAHTKLDKELIDRLNQREINERDNGNRFYSESTALNHINSILKKRKASADTQ